MRQIGGHLAEISRYVDCTNQIAYLVDSSTRFYAPFKFLGRAACCKTTNLSAPKEYRQGRTPAIDMADAPLHSPTVLAAPLACAAPLSPTHYPATSDRPAAAFSCPQTVDPLTCAPHTRRPHVCTSVAPCLDLLARNTLARGVLRRDGPPAAPTPPPVESTRNPAPQTNSPDDGYIIRVDLLFEHLLTDSLHSLVPPPPPFRCYLLFSPPNAPRCPARRPRIGVSSRPLST